MNDENRNYMPGGGPPISLPPEDLVEVLDEELDLVDVDEDQPRFPPPNKENPDDPEPVESLN